MSDHTLSRRQFLYNGAGACLALAISPLAQGMVAKTAGLSMGLITDLHHDVMHDAPERLQAFLDEMKKAKPDAIMQMGDFAYPSAKNQFMADLFNNAHQTALHVIGNHDTDSGHTHQQCLDAWKMPATYYAKKVNGFWLLVLNGNDKGSATHKGGYPSYVGPRQVQWLKSKLAEIQEPIIVAIHQPLVGFLAIDNAAEIKEIISAANDRVVLVINGHTHIDSLNYVEQVPYLTINSASYFWVGQNYMHDSFSKEIHQSHEWISRTCPYSNPLFTTLTINPKKMTIELKSKKGEWVGKSPAELGYADPLLVNDEVVPFIRKRKLPVPANARAKF